MRFRFDWRNPLPWCRVLLVAAAMMIAGILAAALLSVFCGDVCLVDGAMVGAVTGGLLEGWPTGGTHTSSNDKVNRRPR